MAAQEEKKQVKTEGKPSFFKTQEAKILMYIVPVIAILLVVAYLFKQ